MSVGRQDDHDGNRPRSTWPLFIYGSLRDPGVRAGLLGERLDLTTCPAILRGHTRQRVSNFDYPFVVPAAPAARVDGELLLGLQPDDYAILDRYEDVDDGLYMRVGVSVDTAAGPVDAWTYLKGPAAPR
jgi:gamma-glutamylcyclotransferase (GGCT)/AIG2-like uncharacterized protein YtfP